MDPYSELRQAAREPKLSRIQPFSRLRKDRKKENFRGLKSVPALVFIIQW